MIQEDGFFENDLEYIDLREAIILLSNIFNNIPDPICIKDIEDRIIRCNSAALSFWNHTNEEIVGKKCTEIKMCSEPCIESVTKRAYKSKKTVKIQKYITKAEKWVDVMAYPVIDKDTKEVQFLIEHIKDITELKRAEIILQDNLRCQEKLLLEAEQNNRFKTEFFANISHELKTPLNIILSTLQLLETYYLSSKQTSKYTNIMKQNCYRLLRLLNNIIDMTKIESGFYKLRLENADIVNVVKQITFSVDQYIKNKSINLIFENKINKRIMSFDAEKIERIMLNLLSNAAKFTLPRGEIRVVIEEKNGIVIISVKDTGIGIPPEKQNLIFQRFGQVDSHITRDHEGSGIGLSLAKSLVEMHGGEIYFHSEIQRGTTFIIELPIRILDEEIKKHSNYESNQYKNVEILNIELSDIYE